MANTGPPISLPATGMYFAMHQAAAPMTTQAPRPGKSPAAPLSFYLCHVDTLPTSDEILPILPPGRCLVKYAS